MKLKHVALTSGILVGILVLVLFTTIYLKPPTPSATPSVHLVSYEWDVYVESWEHECVEANITLVNLGNGDANFTLEIDLYDDDQYFGCRLQKIELPAGKEETFFVRVWYELLVNKHHANTIEIICGVYGEDACLEELYFREFFSKGEA